MWGIDLPRRAKKAVKMNKDKSGSRKVFRFAALLVPLCVCALVSCGKTAIKEETDTYSSRYYETTPVVGSSSVMNAPSFYTTVQTFDETTDETTALTTLTQTSVESSQPEKETTSAATSQTTAETTTGRVETTTSSAPATKEPDEYTLKTSYRDVIPYETKYVYSDKLYEGEREILKNGVNGEQLTTVYSTYRDGKLSNIVSEKRTVTSPVSEEILVGTAPVYTSIVETESVDTPFSTRYVYDDKMYEDDEDVISEGATGKETMFYTVTFKYGKEESREATGINIVPPVDRVIKKGTKPVLSTQTVVRRENTVSAGTEYVYDADMYEGESVTARVGVDGYETNTYLITYTKGIKTGEELVSSVKTEVINTKIKIGTRKKAEEMRMPFYTAAEGGADYYVSQYYGGTNDHGGIDFGVYYGSPILAVMSGTVVYAYNDGYFSKSNILWTYGTYVVIEHENGIRTYYAHLSSKKVSVGDKVKQGQVIGYSGNTGRVSPAPTQSNPYAGTHLHFEVRVLSWGTYKKVDPRDYLPRWK